MRHRGDRLFDNNARLVIFSRRTHALGNGAVPVKPFRIGQKSRSRSGRPQFRWAASQNGCPTLAGFIRHPCFPVSLVADTALRRTGSDVFIPMTRASRRTDLGRGGIKSPWLSCRFSMVARNAKRRHRAKGFRLGRLFEPLWFAVLAVPTATTAAHEFTQSPPEAPPCHSGYQSEIECGSRP